MRARRRSRAKPASWLTMGTDLAMLGVEAQMVIGQRMAMFMLGGPKADKEARLMVIEKVKAASKAAATHRPDRALDPRGNGNRSIKRPISEADGRCCRSRDSRAESESSTSLTTVAAQGIAAAWFLGMENIRIGSE